MILYVNSCIRSESRTDRIARALLEKLGGTSDELTLASENLEPLSPERLNRRTELIRLGDYSDPMFRYSKQFAAADTIVIAAPYWDLSFPALLKTYLENIYVTGIVSRFTPEGIPEGLCRAEKLYYVTTSGGPYRPDFSYNCIRDMAIGFFGIAKTYLIFAENLDIIGNNSDEIVETVIRNL